MTLSQMMGAAVAVKVAVDSCSEIVDAIQAAIERGDTDKVFGLLLGAIAGGAAVYLAPTALGWVIGISPAGPIKGGLFAALQSYYGNIKAGSTMAQTQSFVMGGASAKFIVIGALMGATLAAKLTSERHIVRRDYDCHGPGFCGSPELRSKL